MPTTKKLITSSAWFALLVILLYWAMRKAPLPEILASLQLLQAWQIVALLLLNSLIFCLITARWWLIVQAEARQIRFWPLITFRLAAFGLSYFTPGPQIGGEPLQILYLKRSYGLTTVRATAAVLMDKLLEFLANFLFLAIGLFAVTRSGMLARFTPSAWIAIPLGLVLLWPLVHILLLYQHKHPLSALLAPLRHHLDAGIGPNTQTASWQRMLQPWQTGFANSLRLIIVSEHLAALFCRRHLKTVLAALAVSLLAWAGMLLEYLGMLHFLAVHLNFSQTLAALTVVRLSFLAPLPAGLGALEASQVFAFTSFGLPAALGISLSLLMRGRDLLLGGLGLLIAALKK